MECRYSVRWISSSEKGSCLVEIVLIDKYNIKARIDKLDSHYFPRFLYSYFGYEALQYFWKDYNLDSRNIQIHILP